MKKINTKLESLKAVKENLINKVEINREEILTYKGFIDDHTNELEHAEKELENLKDHISNLKDEISDYENCIHHYEIDIIRTEKKIKETEKEIARLD